MHTRPGCLIYGREDVAMNQERAFQLAEEGVSIGLLPLSRRAGLLLLGWLSMRRE